MSGSGAAADVLRRSLTALADGDTDTVIALFADDAVAVDMTDPASGRSGDDLRRKIIEYRADFAEMRIEFKSLFTDGTLVGAEVDLIGTMAADGRRVVTPHSIVAKVVDGRVQWQHYYYNPAHL